jgi:FrmR/RcnR family transcriptional regulator, repressor of frmRAB operon
MVSPLEGMGSKKNLAYTPWGYRLAPMPHAPEDKRKALLRVRRIQGQTEALARALEAGEACGPVLVQLAAIRGAVNGLMSEILQSHIREELGALPEADDRHARLAQDMTTLVRTYLK